MVRWFSLSNGRWERGGTGSSAVAGQSMVTSVRRIQRRRPFDSGPERDTTNGMPDMVTGGARNLPRLLAPSPGMFRLASPNTSELLPKNNLATNTLLVVAVLRGPFCDEHVELTPVDYPVFMFRSSLHRSGISGKRIPAADS
jgi:hypothetical protein